MFAEFNHSITLIFKVIIVAREIHFMGNLSCATLKFAGRISVCIHYIIVAREIHFIGNLSCATFVYIIS